MDALTEILTANPNCRVTINFSNSKPRKKAREGDIKFVRGRKMIRQQRMSQGCYLVNRGRPQYEWVEWENSREFEFQEYIRKMREERQKK